MTAATVTAPRRVGVGRALQDMLLITRRNLLRVARMPQLLVFATVQPVMFLLLFNYVFGGAIAGPASSDLYINYLLPGILVQTVVFGATNTATGLTEDLAAGVIDRFRSLPMARSAVLAGRTLADLVRSTLVNTLMILVGFLIGFRPEGLPELLLGLLLALLFGYAMSWVFATIGMYAKVPEAAQAATFLVVFPLTFASSVFVPTQTMPSWLQVFAENQPVSVVANAVRGLVLGGQVLPPGDSIESLVLQSFAWIVAIVVVFAPIGVRFYRRAVS